MRIVVHVGAHKTGSSLVQEYLRRSARRRVASGVAVIPRHHAHELIGWGVTVLRHPDRLRRRIEAEARRQPAVLVISDECALGRPFEESVPGLYPRAPERAAALARVCDGFDTRVVMYLRPIAGFVESFYLQTVQEGAAHTFEEWFAGIEADSLAWTTAVEGLGEAFGRRAVEIGDFREFGSGQNLFLRRFLERAGIAPWTTVRHRHRSNPSISQAGLELALERNALLTSVEERQASRRQLQNRYSNLDGPRAHPMPLQIRELLESMSGSEYEHLTRRTPAYDAPR